ncbi:MAG: hypothetical protein SGBAC_001825 [Bacillariaceae sp.]
MGVTKKKQQEAKSDTDQKFAMAQPNRQILEDLAVACAKDPSPDNTFQYAFCLSKSSERSELRYAISILDGLVKEGYEHQMDCMYGSACAFYLLEDYERCRERCENILRSNPESRLTMELHLACIESKEQKEAELVKKTAIGGAVAMGALGVAGAVASVLLTKR